MRKRLLAVEWGWGWRWFSFCQLPGPYLLLGLWLEEQLLRCRLLRREGQGGLWLGLLQELQFLFRQGDLVEGRCQFLERGLVVQEQFREQQVVCLPFQL
jgi:hypothetical protein